jgi:hypothetical protein
MKGRDVRGSRHAKQKLCIGVHFGLNYSIKGQLWK